VGGISIDWRFSLGKRAAASADGRMAGETLSKNLCASPSADREGVTAQILSVASLNGNDMPNGSVLDLSLHSSAVKGEDGLSALMATLDTFMRLGGMAIQYNVLDVATLRAAQRDLSLYPNLQVRLCGWNVLFSTLSKQEQDEFIQQAEVSA
jgi:formate C-acetyltransferase